MFKRKAADRPPCLYRMFRAELLRYGRESSQPIEAWHMLPKEGLHTGRLLTVSMIRKWMKQIEKEFPGGALLKGGKLVITPELAEFAKTHDEMCSTEQEVLDAWEAMRGIGA